MTNKTYRLAIDSEHAVKPFGPLFTLQQAEKYQDDMILGGFNVLVINCATYLENLKTITRQDRIAAMVARHKTTKQLTRHSLLTV